MLEKHKTPIMHTTWKILVHSKIEWDMSVTCLGHSNQHKSNNHKSKLALLHNLKEKTSKYHNKHTLQNAFKHRHVCMHECIKIIHTRVLSVKVVYEHYIMFI